MIVRGSHNINVAQPRFGYRLLDIVVFITLFPTLTITTVFVFCFFFVLVSFLIHFLTHSIFLIRPYLFSLSPHSPSTLHDHNKYSNCPFIRCCMISFFSVSLFVPRELRNLLRWRSVIWISPYDVRAALPGTSLLGRQWKQAARLAHFLLLSASSSSSQEYERAGRGKGNKTKQNTLSLPRVDDALLSSNPPPNARSKSRTHDYINIGPMFSVPPSAKSSWCGRHRSNCVTDRSAGYGRESHRHYGRASFSLPEK